MERPAGFKYAVAKFVDGHAEWSWPSHPEFPPIKVKCRFGQPGDIFWVRETWANGGNLTSGPGYIFKASDYPKDFIDQMKWKPSIHMPKDAARIWLKNVGVRIERLQDISESDAKAEGCKHAHDWRQPGVKTEKTESGFKVSGTKSFRRGYSILWDTINGEDSWLSNPFVWVIEFERI